MNQMKPNIENRISETLNSFEGIQTASPQNDLWKRIESRIHDKKVFVSRKIVWVAAASFLLLFFLNLILLNNSISKNKSSTTETINMVEQYQLIPQQIVSE